MPGDDSRVPWDEIRGSARIVVKIGTSSLLHDDRTFDFKSIATLIHDIKTMVKQDNKEVVLVSSGAVSAGMKKLGMDERPRDLVLQQVAASVGNPLLFNEYVRMFDDVPVAQVLVTQQDLSNRVSYNHFSNAMEMLLKMRIVPIVNENDVVSIDELAETRSGESGKEYNFSDNDVLSALVAASIGADVLVILSDIDGLFSKHPNAPGASLIPLVEALTPDIMKLGRDGGKAGRGGMTTKLRAAQIATQAGAWMIIGHAKKVELRGLMAGTCTCTAFKPAPRSLRGRKLWMIFAATVEGRILVDQGAARAIAAGASLLLPGVTGISGDFPAHSVVEIWDETNGKPVARGVAGYSSQEIARFTALHRKDPGLFKSQGVDEIVSRDKLAVLH